MPFKKWEVEPVFLSRKPLPAGVAVNDELEATANTTLVGSLRQLACLLQLARHVFQGITAECQLVHQRAELLHSKVKHCEGLTESLDAKSVAVPVSNLQQYSQIQQHYGTRYEQSTQTFQESSRPDCVKTLYKKASATPVPIIRTIDRYRTDGRTGSKLFMVTPVLGDEEKKKNEHLDIETRRPASFALARDWQEDEEFSLPDVTRLAWLVSPSSERMSRGNADKSLVRLPSPEERMHALSLDYPSSVVPVDVTGSSLHRLFGLRRSLIHADFIIKRKKKKKTKRRNTIAEGSSKELQEAVKNSRELVHTSCQTDDLLDGGQQVSRPLQTRRSFFFRKKDGTLPKEPQLWKDGHAAVSSGGGPKVADKKAEAAETNRKTDKSSAKSRVRSFIPISTLSSAMTVAVKLRQSSSRAGGKPGDDGRSSSGNWSGSSSTRASVDSDHQQASVSPDGACSPSRSSLGKDSVLSDYTHQDIDGRSQDDTLTGYTSETSTSAAPPPHSQVSAPKPAQEPQVDDSWLQTTDQGTQSSTSTPENYPSDTTSTPQVLSPFLTRRDPGGTTSPQPSPGPMDDGDSSVYSVDTDGYYTSMHTDSGLWNRSSHRHLDLSHDMGRGKVRRGSQSSVSTVGNGSLNSFLSRTVTEGSSVNGSLTKKKVPPQPPPRISSITKPSEKEQENEEKIQDVDGKKMGSDSSESPLPLNGEVSTSDSDHEAGERIKEKTTINPSRYPSMCAVSPETSDDDDRLGKCEQSGSARVAVVTVAEIHQVEAPEDATILPQPTMHKPSSSQPIDVQNSAMSSKGAIQETRLPVSQPSLQKKAVPSTLNMYCDQYMQNSTFSSALNRNSPKSPSPEKPPLASFSPQHNSTSPTAFNNKGPLQPNNRQNAISGHFQGDGSRLIISSPPVDSQHLSPQEEKSLIPLKYAQHITVTPKARELSPTSPSSPTNKVPRSPSTPLTPPSSLGYPTSMQTDASPTTFRFPPLCQNGHTVQSHIPTAAGSTQTQGPASNSHMTSSPVHQTSPARSPWPSKSPLSRSTSFTVASPEKTMARVTLDPSGKVIYASNSLGRRRSGYPPQPQPSFSPSQDQKFATLPLRQSLACQLPSSVSNATCGSEKMTSPIRNSRCSPSTSEQRRENSIASAQQNGVYPQSKDSAFRIIRYDSSPTRYGNGSPCKVPPSKSSSAIYSPSHQKEGIPSSRSTLFSPNDYHTSSVMPASPQSQSSSSSSSLSSQSLSAWKNDMRRAFFDSPLISSSRTSQVNSIQPSSTPRTSTPQTPSFSNSPSPVTSQSRCPPSASVVQSTPNQAVPNENTGSASITPSEDSKRKPLSAAELFAIIHKSKKRHNIKTDPEASSSPLSSRSSSPSVGRPSTPSKGALAETGFLTPRSTITNTPNNRHSWVGDSIVSSSATVPERKSLVQDRLGPSRPTSMHDFKMLLLQTRSTTNSDRSQKSATELLKTSAPKRTNVAREESMSQSLPTSPVKSLSSGAMMSPSPTWSGHSTVPMKRGARIRSSLQPRYDLAYPPIWEDCSEDGEIHRDQQNSHPDTLSSDCVKGNQNYPIFRQSALAHSQENKVSVPHHNGTQPAPVTSTWV